MTKDDINISVQVFVDMFSFLQDEYLEEKLLGHMPSLCLTLQELPNCLPKWLLQFLQSYKQYESSNCFKCTPILLYCPSFRCLKAFLDSFSSRYEVESHVVLICTLASYIYSFVKHMFKSPAHFYQLIFFSGCTPWNMESLFPNQGLNPGLLHWKHEAITTGLRGSPLS